jgi:peptidoglycan-N-acetylglucosamine deacetylase
VVALIAFLLTTPSLAADPIPLAITVDDLPIHGAPLPSEPRSKIAARFLAVLKRHGVVEAYGFVNAKKVKDDPTSLEVMTLWKKAGFPLGNHTYSHMRLNTATVGEFIKDIKSNEALLDTLESPSVYKWFRYPFLNEGDSLEKRNAVRKALHDLQYKIAQVTVDFEDWAWNDAYVRCVQSKDKKAIQWLEASYLEHATIRLEHAKKSALKLFGRPIQHILLLHAGLFDSLMLDKLLSAYEKAGAQFVPLKQATSDPIYLDDPGLTPSAGGTYLDQVAQSKGLPLPLVKKLPFKKLKAICTDGS